MFLKLIVNTLFILTGELSKNFSRDYAWVLDTTDQYWVDSNEHFSQIYPTTGGAATVWREWFIKWSKLTI